MQSRTVRLHWRLSNPSPDRFMHHFIIYYRRLTMINIDDDEDSFNIEDYQQLLVDGNGMEREYFFEVRVTITPIETSPTYSI